MRSKLNKIKLAATIAFAIAFTFNACGSDSSGEDGPSGGNSSSGGANELGCGEWAVTTPATCVAEGVETRTCTGDNPRTETRATPIDPKDHDWELISGTAATCSATGNGDEICKRCGKEVKGVLPIDPHAHDWGNWATKTPATCTEKEVEERVCSHNALHKEDGEVGEPLTWGEWTVTTPATPTSVGEETRTCPGNASPAQTHPLYPECNGVEYDPAEKFCDERDNKLYKYVTIGTGATAQTWMAENLNFNATGSRCYGDGAGGDSQNRCRTYGRLYNWNTAMDGAVSSTANPSGVQGVCPSGWHLPSDAEWAALARFAGGTGVQGDGATAGTKLKAKSGWSTGGKAGTDDYGFSALPGGYGYSGGFYMINDYGYWWSSSENSTNSSNANYRQIYNAQEYLYYENHAKSYLKSVRCVRD